MRVIAEFVGGGFGAKIGPGVEGILAAELSRRSGRPVRVVTDRHGELLDGGRRPATRQTVRLGAKHDGTLAAVEVDAVIATGQNGRLTSFITRQVLAPAALLYRCENVTGTAFPLRVNLRAPNAFRAPGVMEGTTALEQAVDVSRSSSAVTRSSCAASSTPTSTRRAASPTLQAAAPVL